MGLIQEGRSAGEPLPITGPVEPPLSEPVAVEPVPEMSMEPPGPTPRRPVERVATIRVPVRHNARLHAIIERVNADAELQALWRAANVNAVDRLGMSDHGPIHVQIVANIALRLLRLLVASGETPSIVRHHGLDPEDAEVVVVLGALLHDVGMSMHRDDHERFSLIISYTKLRELLDGIYDVRVRTAVSSDILHAIISHRSGGRPQTLEAGVVRVADALDMAKGRSHIPFEAGKVNIHSVSAFAIERVELARGTVKPIRIAVQMRNSAGVFQLDELLKEKLHGSGIEHLVEVEATIEGDTEPRLVQSFRF